MAANVTLRKNLSYDPLTSFLPVHMMAESPNIFVAFEAPPSIRCLSSLPTPGSIQAR